MKYFLLFLFISLGLNAQTLTSIYFTNNSSELNKESKIKLDSLAQLKSKLTFRIFGNANPLGNETLNKKLSENRAKNVTDYLKHKIGGNINLASSVGLGITKQINDNSSENLLAKNRRVDIFIEKFFDKGEKISRSEYPSFFDVKIAQMKVKDTFSLPNVNFIGGRHAWLSKGTPKLFMLFEILKKNPTLEVELQGHICCDYENFDGEDLDLKTFNLSFTRANAIRNFLIKMGIEPNRIKAEGLGHLNPVVYPEITEEDMSKNRRVEIVVTKK
ncbi:OmpA family protein [Chryseobacterium luquanense]|uniref:OmpA family protein n=1 Tax=Chryseobacterium luquanense TaxID=2983766 RepID=A0ABT3XZ01_9FLAO|nr:OmpA family protein [Chryseobacterium luquanense]MCX8531115.1 OmpA family protein [Chryseobacterium luquanense]